MDIIIHKTKLLKSGDDEVDKIAEDLQMENGFSETIFFHDKRFLIRYFNCLRVGERYNISKESLEYLLDKCKFILEVTDGKYSNDEEIRTFRYLGVDFFRARNEYTFNPEFLQDIIDKFSNLNMNWEENRLYIEYRW